MRETAPVLLRRISAVSMEKWWAENAEPGGNSGEEAPRPGGHTGSRKEKEGGTEGNCQILSRNVQNPGE